MRGDFFKNEKFPKCTSETIKARPFQRKQKYFLLLENDLAFIVSDVQFGNSLLKKRNLVPVVGVPAKNVPALVRDHDAGRQVYFGQQAWPLKAQTEFLVFL
jgi:hypothetical protein